MAPAGTRRILAGTWCLKALGGCLCPRDLPRGLSFQQKCKSERVGAGETSLLLLRVPKAESRALDPCLVLHKSPGILQERKAVGIGAAVLPRTLLLVVAVRAADRKRERILQCGQGLKLLCSLSALKSE